MTERDAILREIKDELGALEDEYTVLVADRDRLAAQLAEAQTRLNKEATEHHAHRPYGERIRLYERALRDVQKILSTPTPPAPDPAAQGACRRCSDCEGERHHWTEDPRVTDPSDWACRHCDTRGVSCPDCELEEREDCELCGGCGVVEIAGHNPESAPGGEEGGR